MSDVIVPPNGFKLGCHISPPRERARMLKISEFRTPMLIEPIVRNWYTATSGIKMHRNDELGICTCAGGSNLDQVWTANTGTERIMDDASVTKDYEEACGYDPTQDVFDVQGNYVSNPTDQGGCLSDILKMWQNVGLFGSKIGPYLAINPTDWEEVCFSINSGVGIYCGISLPQSAMDAMQLPVPRWDMPTDRSGKRILGGHCVIDCSYDFKGEELGTGTWAQIVPTVADFIAAYYSEMYLIFSPDFMKDGVSPAGLNGDAILDAFAQVKKRDG